jgi:transposase
MGKPYSDDLRIRMIEAVEAGSSRRSVALQYKVGVSTVIRLLQAWKATGSCSPKPMGGTKPYALEVHGAMVDHLLAERCDLTLDELRAALAEKDVKVSRTAIDRYLKARGITRKKRPHTPPNKNVRTLPPSASSGAKNSRS